MVKSYSNDLRERVVGAVEPGDTVRLVTERLGVSTLDLIPHGLAAILDERVCAGLPQWRVALPAA